VNVRLLEIAQLELDGAIAYYNEERPGLGDAFLVEIVATIKRIKGFPDAWHPMGQELRRAQLRRFPYGLIYAVDKGDVLIVAIAHLHRKPNYWRERLARK
jgi:plasmid stabilization system protein ParE